MRETILHRMETGVDLPAFPELLTRLQETMGNPDVSMSAIAEIIELDPVLSGKVLKLSNSVLFSRSPKTITSLPLAITRLGLKQIYRLAYSLKLTSLFGTVRIINARQFWRHSLAVAFSTQALSQRIHAAPEAADIAYLSGLMHDIGIAVFSCLIPEEYQRFLESAVEVEKPLEIQESEKFDIDHAEIGALFATQSWNIDNLVSLGIRYHHFPFHGTPEERRCEQLVSIANGICNNQGITHGIPCYSGRFHDSAWEDLNLSLAEADEIISDIKTSLEQAEAMLTEQ